MNGVDQWLEITRITIAAGMHTMGMITIGMTTTLTAMSTMRRPRRLSPRVALTTRNPRPMHIP
ncbi:MAG: hypothetical protein AB7I36_20035 [Rhodospirillaceae bacterium]